MKSIQKIIVALSVVAFVSCAETNPPKGVNDDSTTYFDAWVAAQKAAHPEFEWRKTGLGSMVLLSEITAGDPLGTQDDSPYILVDYTMTSMGKDFVESDLTLEGHPPYYLCGRVISTTEKAIARQMGTYKVGDYYGPLIVQRSSNAVTAGLDEILSEMKIGERRWVVIPGWLSTNERYASAELYLQNVTGVNSVYDITVRDTIKNVNVYQLDSMKTFIKRHFPQKALDDTTSTGWGCYYIQKKAPRDTNPFPADTTFKINYTGRLLNGQVFDTTIADTAKVWGIYDKTKKYEPVQVNWGATASDITLSSNKTSVISGFSKGLWQMRHKETGYSIFYSALGYGSSGSGNTIPAFSPLMFELEILEEK